MQKKTTTRQSPVTEEQDVYTFERENGMWYIVLPPYLERGWDKRELLMAEGAHKFLNVLSNGASKLRIRIGTQPLEGAGKLEVVEHCDAPKGGAIYLYTPADNRLNPALFWICDLALFVFGDIPDHIYVQRLLVNGNAFLHPKNGPETIGTRTPS